MGEEEEEPPEAAGGGPGTATLAERARAGAELAGAGAREAFAVHRLLVFFARRERLLARTGSCLLLNLVVFMGSIGLLRHVLVPCTRRVSSLLLPLTEGEEFGLLARLASSEARAKGYAFGASWLLGLLEQLLVGLFNLFWLVPAYGVSFLINSMYYNEIAENAWIALQEGEAAEGAPRRRDGVAGAWRRRRTGCCSSSPSSSRSWSWTP